MAGKNLIMQFIDWNITSSISMGIDLLLVYLLTHYLGIYYVHSVVIGFAVAVTLNYTVGRLWIFKGTKRGLKSGYLISIVLAITYLVIITAMTYFFVEDFGLNYLLARFITGIVVGLLSYAADSTINYKMPILPYQLKHVHPDNQIKV